MVKRHLRRAQRLQRRYGIPAHLQAWSKGSGRADSLRKRALLCGRVAIAEAHRIGPLPAPEEELMGQGNWGWHEPSGCNMNWFFKDEAVRHQKHSSLLYAAMDSARACMHQICGGRANVIELQRQAKTHSSAARYNVGMLR